MGKDEDKNLSIEEYPDKIKLYLSDMIINHKIKKEKWKIHSAYTIVEHKTQGEFKIQLAMEINFISAKRDSDEARTMRTKSNNIAVIMGS